MQQFIDLNHMIFSDPMEVLPGSIKDSLMLSRLTPHDFLSGLRDNEFRPVFQPVVRSDGSLSHFELLMRWDRCHPDAGQRPLGPQKFCDFAERLGVSIDLWRFALSRAEAFLQRLDHHDLHHVGVSINASPSDLLDPVLEIEMYRFMCRHPRSECSHSGRVSIEITESALLDASGVFYHRINRMRESGVCFAIDDFGVGYSSLSRIQFIEPDYIKLDKSFMKSLEVPRHQAFLEKIVELCHLTGARVVAEGIEDAEQSERAILAGCDDLQGYFYGKPMQEDDALSWATSRLTLPSRAVRHGA